MKMLKKVKVILNYLTDRKILIGTGIGIIIGVVFMFGYKYENSKKSKRHGYDYERWGKVNI